MNNRDYKSKVTLQLEKNSKDRGYVFKISETDSDSGYFETNDGRRSFFTYGTLDINTNAATEYANDKSLSSSLMRDFGIRLPKEKKIIYSENRKANDLVAEIDSFITSVGLPVIFKPVHGRQGNSLFKITSSTDLTAVLINITNIKEDFLVQEYIEAEEIRVVVLDGEVIQAYLRDFFHVIGNGQNTIKELIEIKNNDFEAKNRNTRINLNDTQITTILKIENLSLGSKLQEAYRLNLSYGRNLSKGGEYRFIEDKLSTPFKSLLRDMAHFTGLRLVGFDLFILNKPESISDRSELVYIEHNASPDMENNFYFDSEYHKRFEEIYRRIFGALFK